MYKYSKYFITKKHILQSIITLLFVVALSSLLINNARAADATLNIKQADSIINNAFLNVLAAENAGGNVTELMSRLNSAGALLAQAQNAYNSGAGADVTSIAENAGQIAEEVNTDAINLRNAILANSQGIFLPVLIFSIAGAILFSISWFFAWKRFKRSFIKKQLDLKPEVIENSS